MRRIAIALAVVWLGAAGVEASYLSCKWSVEGLLPEADLVVRGEILEFTPGVLGPCSAFPDENGEIELSESCGTLARVRLRVAEYLVGEGPGEIGASLTECGAIGYPDRFALLPGTEVVAFLKATKGTLEVVAGEGGILDPESLRFVRCALRTRDLALSVELGASEVPTGRQVGVTHTLRNDGRERWRGCVVPGSSWTFTDAKEAHGVGLDSWHAFQSPPCLLDLDLAPGESVRWSRRVGVPTAVEHGVVRLTAELQVQCETEREVPSFLGSTVVSPPVLFFSVPEKR